MKSGKVLMKSLLFNSGSEIQGESENPFSQRFPQSHRQESKKILAKFSNLYSMSICENPKVLAKTSMENLNGFSHYVTNFYPCNYYFTVNIFIQKPPKKNEAVLTHRSEQAITAVSPIIELWCLEIGGSHPIITHIFFDAQFLYRLQ